MEKVCGSCKFFDVAKLADVNTPGACRESPPVPIPIMQQNPLTGQAQMGIQPMFPPVFRGDWCGKWQEKPVGIVQ